MTNGISLHRIPFFDDDRPEAKRRRRKWVEFVNRKRAKWLPSKSSAVCSVHFMPEDFTTCFGALPGMKEGVKRRLIEDDVGVVPVSSVYAEDISEIDGSWSLSRRNRRMVGYLLVVCQLASRLVVFLE